MLTTDKINCSLDFERDGKHFGNLELSFSDNQNAFAKIPVPVVRMVPACRAADTCSWWRVKWSVTMLPGKADIQSAIPRNKPGHNFLRWR
jgi:hypothetical protein